LIGISRFELILDPLSGPQHGHLASLLMRVHQRQHRAAFHARQPRPWPLSAGFGLRDGLFTCARTAWFFRWVGSGFIER
jgi:hypothetical protein